MINILLWVGFGALSGWIFSLLFIVSDRHATIRSILIGISGALGGGMLSQLLKGESVSSFNETSIAISVVGSLALIGTLKKLSM